MYTDEQGNKTLINESFILENEDGERYALTVYVVRPAKPTHKGGTARFELEYYVDDERVRQRDFLAVVEACRAVELKAIREALQDGLVPSDFEERGESLGDRIARAIETR